MNGILGFAELLKEPEISGEDKNRFVAIIEKSGHRMLNIINDLIDISKIEAGQIEVSLSEINIREQAEYLYTFFKPEMAKKGIGFKCSIPDDLPQKTIVSDREKVYAILTNLLKNAVKYTDQGTVEFGYQLQSDDEDNSRVVYFVKDTGIGIPKDRLEAIFDRFVQADIEDRHAREGAGLGLAISKAYAQMLGGRLTVKSEPDKGSTFYFSISNHENAKTKKKSHLKTTKKTQIKPKI